MNVMLNDEKGKTAVVVVPDKQLSLAIGKEGQNARLAAKLTGWRIDIKSSSEAIAETLDRLREDKALRERLAGKAEIFNMASIIHKDKVPVEYTDAELNVLSQAIEAVNLAEMAMRRELKVKQAAEAEAAKQAARTRDILAEAEAILTGQAPATIEEAPAEAEPEVEPAVEPEEIAAEVVETEAAAEVEVEPEAVATPETEEEVVAVTESILAESEPLTLEPLAVAEDWTEDEEDGDTEKEQGKKKARAKKRRLVFDEQLGEVVAERRRKPSRRGGGWLDYNEDE
jgi:N utilization substance protein A